MPSDLEWQVDEIAGHRWDGDKLELLVHWTAGEHIWESVAECAELQALDDYLRLLGVADATHLPRRSRDITGAPPSI
ncbi:hypothetical protein LXA43DRAFT_60387 [Ganoderma leucocontextum]|nr:hypothetical protein LXA43DRAFT_60387 [Ganoderma leucocontextum]